MNVAQHKIVNLLKTFFFFAYQFLLVFVYLMCGPRQFFQCGPEMPKGCTLPFNFLPPLIPKSFTSQCPVNFS